ncbi:50S ribosomal protein L4 [Pedobacter sp.]|nr:50S ribosomal protein L4 [Candidatus Saccharibacteria bacterium]
MVEKKTNVTTPKLPDSIFAVEVKNHELLKLAYDSYLANARKASATTKRRGEVSGGGKKPWKQKGTGRARFGSSRNPIWRGGGIVFGPLGIENYKKRISTGSKRVAIRQALSLAKLADKIMIDEIKTTGKTKEVIAHLKTAKIDGVRRILVVVDEKTPEMLRATKNIQNLLLVRANYLSVYHILNADQIILSPASIPVIEKWLSKEEA